MDWFERIKMYYETGLWDISRVKDAVKKDKISESQFKEITGQEYDT